MKETGNFMLEPDEVVFAIRSGGRLTLGFKGGATCVLAGDDAMQAWEMLLPQTPAPLDAAESEPPVSAINQIG